jgi:hypothetical protein
MGDIMRQIIIRSLATAGVLGGFLFTGVGVAAAQPEIPAPPEVAVPEATLPAPPEVVVPEMVIPAAGAAGGADAAAGGV